MPLINKFLIAFLFLGCFLSFSTSPAQVVDYGQNPPNLYWNKILSPHFQVIFPKELGERAERLINVLERVYRVENHSIKVNTQPITIILQNQPVESNAFVLLAPRRSEFNTLPPQDLEPIDWLNSLAVHEMRHVVQMDRVFNGKEATIFETIQLGIFGLVYPTWFFEGDAVDMETLLTEGGRGRLPSWDIDMRTNILSNKNYSYSKYTLGSWKDNVPDYYRIGYFMVTKMRRDYGDSVFNEIYTGSLKIKPYPFSSSLKKNTGFNTHDFFTETIKDLKNQWTDSLKRSQVIYYPSVSQRKDSLALNYRLPKPFTPGKIVFIKDGLDKLPGIYSLDIHTRKEKRILIIGNQTNSNFDYKNQILVWTETRMDPRYQYRDYSNIYLYDFKTHKKKALTHQSKLFSPALNPRADTLVAVQVKTNYTFNLRLIDTRNPGQFLDLPNPNHYFFETPSFDSTGKKIISVVVNTQGKAIDEYNLQTHEERLLKPFTNMEIDRPIYAPGGFILYQSAQTGRDQIFALNLQTQKEQALTASPFGAYSPQLQGDTLWFEDFSSLGRNISQISYSHEIRVPKDTVNRFISYYKLLVPQEIGSKPKFRQSLNQLADDSINFSSGKILGEDSLFKPYPITKFREIGHLFYFHSLLPDIQNFNLNTNTFLTGLKLTSTNLLNTTQTYIGVYYQNGIDALEYQAGITYKKYYPQIIFNFTDKKRNALAIENLNTGQVFLPYSYRSRILDLGLYIPLNFVSSIQNYTANFQVTTSFQNNYALSIPLSRFANFNTYIKFPLHYSLLFEKDKKTSVRDIYPEWGQNIALDFEHLPFSNNLKGHYFAMNSGFYFPGFLNHHVFRLGLNYQYNVGIYVGQRSLDEISGFSYLPPNALQNTLLADYYFPIAYPDWELGRWAFIRRWVGNVFYDRENLGSNPQSYAGYATYGASLRMDVNLLRYYLPVFQLGTKLILFQDSHISGPKIEFVLNYTL
jgi:hypothetical protein